MLLIRSEATARHLRSLWVVNHHADLVAVDCGTVSIYVLLASMNRADLGADDAIFNHHGYYFISPSLGTANGCERNKSKIHGIAQPLSGLVKTTAWSVMMMTLMK